MTMKNYYWKARSVAGGGQDYAGPLGEVDVVGQAQWQSPGHSNIRTSVSPRWTCRACLPGRWPSHLTFRDLHRSHAVSILTRFGRDSRMGDVPSTLTEIWGMVLEMGRVGSDAPKESLGGAVDTGVYYVRSLIIPVLADIPTVARHPAPPSPKPPSPSPFARLLAGPRQEQHFKPNR